MGISKSKPLFTSSQEKAHRKDSWEPHHHCPEAPTCPQRSRQWPWRSTLFLPSSSARSRNWCLAWLLSWATRSSSRSRVAPGCRQWWESRRHWVRASRWRSQRCAGRPWTWWGPRGLLASLGRGRGGIRMMIIVFSACLRITTEKERIKSAIQMQS